MAHSIGSSPGDLQPVTQAFVEKQIELIFSRNDDIPTIKKKLHALGLKIEDINPDRIQMKFGRLYRDQQDKPKVVDWCQYIADKPIYFSNNASEKDKVKELAYFLLETREFFFKKFSDDTNSGAKKASQFIQLYTEENKLKFSVYSSSSNPIQDATNTITKTEEIASIDDNSVISRTIKAFNLQIPKAATQPVNFEYFPHPPNEPYPPSSQGLLMKKF